MSTAEPTPTPTSASFGPVGERKGSVPSGDERLSPYLVAAARAVALPAPRVLRRADCALRSVAQSATPPRRSGSPAIVRDQARRLRSRLRRPSRFSSGKPISQYTPPTRRPNRRTARGRGSSVWALPITVESAPRSSDTPALATGQMWARFRQRESSDAPSTRASDAVGQRRATGTATSFRRRNGRVQGGS